MIGKVLIVDDVSTNRVVFKVKLAAAGYQTIMADSGASCLAAARTERPDLILLDYSLPDMTVDRVLAGLKADPRSQGIPVVVFSAESQAQRRIQALKAGADEFLTKPIDDQTLLARLRNLLRARVDLGGPELAGLAEAPMIYDGPGVVAIVSNRQERAMKLRADLRGVSRDRLVPVTQEQVFEETVRPDVYLIEADLSGPGSGLRLMSELMSRPSSRHATCLILYDRIPPFAAAMAYDLGAHDLADAQVSPAELALRLAKLIRLKREGDAARAQVKHGLRLAMRDPLTGLHNRRYAMAQLQSLAQRSEAQRRGFAVLLIDLDRFKSVNDRHGHAAGDAVLVEVAQRLADSLRAEDLLARVGGEEFLVALPDVTMADAAQVADRLGEAMKARPFRLPGGVALTLTVSIGVTMASSDEAAGGAAGVQAVIDRADRALLSAKAAGRSQVIQAHLPM
jgi:two-component system cell cycle response regulator